MAGAIDRKALQNGDYALWVAAQSAYFLGDFAAARAPFAALAADSRSRFQDLARWRLADTRWQLGERRRAVLDYSELLRRRVGGGDPAVAEFRLAEAALRDRDLKAAARRFRAFLVERPGHALAPRAEARLFEVAGAGAELSAEERIERAASLMRSKNGQAAIAELAKLGDELPKPLRLRREFWTAMTLFSMRRQYLRAGRTLLKIYKELPDRADEALFHGARALSRADLDTEAIGYYQRLVKEYPRSRWAPEAQFLSGWLEFNLGKCARALPHLRTLRARYRGSRFEEDAIWYTGLCHYLLKKPVEAVESFALLGVRRDREVAAKGRYWEARSFEALGESDRAAARYRELVESDPFSWYALLSRARLAERGETIGPFGQAPSDPGKAPALEPAVPSALAGDPLLLRADELLAAGLKSAASRELVRGERGVSPPTPPRGSARRAIQALPSRRQLSSAVEARGRPRRPPRSRCTAPRPRAYLVGARLSARLSLRGRAPSRSRSPAAPFSLFHHAQGERL